MWRILEHRNLEERLGSLPIDILKRYEKWKDIVYISGPAGLRAIRGFNDEPLSGKWRGYRSSRPGRKNRVIYRVEAGRFLVKVIELTPHDYRQQ
jgi:hypothetical protein